MFCTFHGQQKQASLSSKAQVCAKSISEANTSHTLRHTHLEFHLLSLLGVDSHNMLVVPECVPAVLLLCGHVSLQSLQHALWLEDKVEERTYSGNARQ